MLVLFGHFLSGPFKRSWFLVFSGCKSSPPPEPEASASLRASSQAMAESPWEWRLNRMEKLCEVFSDSIDSCIDSIFNSIIT